MKNLNKHLETLLNTDVYKTGHKTLYPQGLTKVFSSFTPRSGNWSGLPHNFVVAHGMRYVIHTIEKAYLDIVNDLTPNQVEKLVKKYEEVVKRVTMVTEFDGSHFIELLEYIREKGKLPVQVRAVKEGTKVNYKVPVMTIYNTNKKFAWFVNYLETWISSELWPIITASTFAWDIKQILLDYANRTGVHKSFVDYQAHDFSFRGMEGSHGAKLVGLGHLSHFKGSDNLPAILEKGYGSSVIATEHSIMSAGTKEGELETYRRLLVDNPNGILSIVSDTWNIYNVCDRILPALKDEIKARNGKLVIRPDSGDAVKVLLGGQKLKHKNAEKIDKLDAKYGLFKLIEHHFGSTLNKKGFKELPITFLWGDGMNRDSISKLLKAMEKAGYASSNVVFGVGSFTYQFKTRDTHGFAMKANYVEINGVGINISKDPITDSGVKKSATGLLAVVDGELVQNTDWKTVRSRKNQLKKVG